MPTLRPVEPAARCDRSSRRMSRTPSFARWKAMLVPMTPPPTTTASAWDSIEAWQAVGREEDCFQAGRGAPTGSGSDAARRYEDPIHPVQEALAHPVLQTQGRRHGGVLVVEGHAGALVVPCVAVAHDVPVVLRGRGLAADVRDDGLRDYLRLEVRRGAALRHGDVRAVAEGEDVRVGLRAEGELVRGEPTAPVPQAALLDDPCAAVRMHHDQQIEGDRLALDGIHRLLLHVDRFRVEEDRRADVVLREHLLDDR